MPGKSRYLKKSITVLLILKVLSKYRTFLCEGVFSAVENICGDWIE